ncbi:MAG TPA: serpin family protein, partial [Candidatus Sabulitectum sp.]|nr:serpin family protein [Candidatus Sabulitectum sp.]
MKNAILVLALLTAAAFSRSIIPPIPDSVADSSLTAGNGRFAVELFREISRESQGDNIFFSPFSISMAMGMTWNGATGETARQMASVLNFDMPVYFVNRSFERITERISSGTAGEMGGEPLTMTVSNGIWVQNGFQLLNSFTEAVTGCYGASA